MGIEFVTAGRLGAWSGWLLLASLLACVAGLAWTVAAAPCSRVGANLLVAAVGLGVISAAALLVRAFMAKPVRSVLALLAVVLVCGLEYFVSYTFTPLLCHGL